MGQMSPKQAAVGIYQENYGPKSSTGSFGGDNSYAPLPKPAALTGKLIVSNGSSCQLGFIPITTLVQYCMGLSLLRFSLIAERISQQAIAKLIGDPRYLRF